MTSSWDKTALLQRARTGDRAAFDQLAALYRGRLAAIVRLRLGARVRERVEVDDVLQETFLRAFQSIDRLRCDGDEAFFRWLATIAEHVVVDLARRHRRRPAVPLVHDVSAGHESPSQGLRRNERFERLEDALDSLSPDYREVILLARIHGLPLADVAERMERSYAATAKLLSRALRELRSSFGDTESLNLPGRMLRDRGEDHVE